MLNGWKAIAAHLRREERTAMRWAKERGMPVHRAPGPGRGSVYALPEEIDAWLRSARVPTETGADAPHVVPSANLEATAPAPSSVFSSHSGPLPDQRMAMRRWRVAALVIGCCALATVATYAMYRPNPRAAGAAYHFTDPVAHAAYLRATFDWTLRTRASLERAIHEYGSVIEQDPRAAPAYIGLANSYLLLREDGTMPDEQAYPRAEAAARAAAALAPDSAETHRALAFIAFWWRHDRVAARDEFARAIALDPGSALTHHWFATALSANGEHAAALREITRAQELDPSDASIIAAHGLLLYLAGHHPEAIAEVRGLEREQPQSVGLHRALADFALWEGRGPEYIEEASAEARLRGDTRSLAVIQEAHSSDASAVIAALLNNARADLRSTGRGWYQLARLASLARRQGEAEDALGHACHGHDLALVAAAGDLWLSRTLDASQIEARCGEARSLLSGRS